MKYILSVFFVLVVFASQAQTPHSISTRNMAWGVAFVNYRITPVWSASLDAQFRYEYTDGDIFQWLIRPSVTYKSQTGWLYSTGLGHFRLYPNPNGLRPRPEWRPWIEAGRKFEFNGKRQSIYPRIRFEQRFIREYAGTELSDELSFHSWRLRLRADYSYLFGKEGNQHWSFLLGDEIMFHQRANGFSSFDQNRVWTGAGYKFSDALTLQLTYLHLFQQRTSSLYDQFHVFRLTAQFTITGKAAKPVAK